MLIVEAGLGDYELATLHWLGDDAHAIAEESGFLLLTSDTPAWWGTDGNSLPEPKTFLLMHPSGEAVTSDTIIWALDQIRLSGAEPRTFVLAMGETGLALREYAEDFASQKQSDRVDLVGLGFCGTPHNGYGAMELYPEQTLWVLLAQSVGLSAEDIVPGSDYLARLNESKLPDVVKSINFIGAAGDIGFGSTDGAGTTEDFTLDESISSQVVTSQVEATISRQVNLTSFWKPFTSSIDYPGRSVDSSLVSRLSAFACYEISDDVQAGVRDFYQAWFMRGCPSTQYSNLLLFDLSGSMNEFIEPGRNKLSVAKDAAKQYLQASAVCNSIPQSAPMSISVIGFNESAFTVSKGFDQHSIESIDDLNAQKETNLGIAFDEALSTLKESPTCANRHILLLSDGESTLGKSDEEVLKDVVAEAREYGIVIDTVGFGEIGESDAGFLEQLSSETGGSYFQADDAYSLNVGFLRSRYSSLGLEYAEEECSRGATSSVVGSTTPQTSAIEVGVIGDASAPEARLLFNGAPLDESLYAETHEGNLTMLEYLNPPVGDYAIELSGDFDHAQIFVVKQNGIVDLKEAIGEQVDYSTYCLIGLGIVAIVAILAVVARTRRAPRRDAASAAESLPDSSFDTENESGTIEEAGVQ